MLNKNSQTFPKPMMFSSTKTKEENMTDMVKKDSRKVPATVALIPLTFSEGVKMMGKSRKRKRVRI